jgi:hypothetical protein
MIETSNNQIETQMEQEKQSVHVLEQKLVDTEELMLQLRNRVNELTDQVFLHPILIFPAKQSKSEGREF